MTVPGTQKIYDKKRFYLSIIRGKLAERVKEGAEGAQIRTTENKTTGEKKIVYEVYYKSITGVLSDTWIHDSDFGEQLMIQLLPDDKSDVIVQIPFKSREARKFLLKLPNINIEKPITITPYNFEDDNDKKVIGLNVHQSEIKIPDYYTFDQPNGYPLPQISEDGKMIYLDKDDFQILSLKQNKFLKEQLAAWRLDNTKSDSEPSTVKNVHEATKPLSDLPFDNEPTF